MNQTQRKALLLDLARIRDQKISTATTIFMGLRENRYVPIPHPNHYPFQKQMTTIAGLPDGAPLAVDRDVLNTKISTNPYLNYNNINDFFQPRNHSAIETAKTTNAEIDSRKKDSLGTKKFLIEREFQNRADSIELSNDYAASVNVVEEFKNLAL